MTRRVVIVDDDPGSLEVMAELVRTWGFNVDAYGDFEACRTALLNGPADALIVDVRLGAYNGLHLAHIARQQNVKMTVVAVSGFDDPVLREEASRINAEYIVKPVDAQKLHGILVVQ